MASDKFLLVRPRPIQSRPILLGDSVTQALRACAGFLEFYLFTSQNINPALEHSKENTLEISNARSLLDLSLLAAPFLYSSGLDERTQADKGHLFTYRDTVSSALLGYQSKNGGFSSTKNPSALSKADPVLSSFSVLALIELNQSNIKNIEFSLKSAANYLSSHIKKSSLSMSNIKIENLIIACTLAQAAISLKDSEIKKEVTKYLQPALTTQTIGQVSSGNKIIPNVIAKAILARIFIDIGLMSNEKAFIEHACVMTNTELHSLLRFTEGLRVEHRDRWFRKKSVSIPYLAAWAVNLVRLGALLDHPQYIDIGGDILRFLTDITNNSLAEYGTCLCEYVSLKGDLRSMTPSPIAIRFYIEACLEAEIIFPKSEIALDSGPMKITSHDDTTYRNLPQDITKEKYASVRLRA